MSYIIICFTSLTISALTFFSGFGLGTLLMPAFALFFPVEIAIAATAIVHLANNLFKAVIMARYANLKVFLSFVLPAAVAAIGGAFLLNQLTSIAPVATYTIRMHLYEITLIKLIVAFLIIIFAVMELLPRFRDLSFPERTIPLGGLISGFFGGLSGLQGALRSAFLIRSGLKKEQFIATGILSAIVIDLSRITVYGFTFLSNNLGVLTNHEMLRLVAAGSLCAFIGAFIGSRVLGKISIRSIQVIVGIMLLLLAVALGAGLI